MSDRTGETPSSRRRAKVELRFVPPTGSAAPRDVSAPSEVPVAGRPAIGGSRLIGSPSFIDEPTQRLPVVTPRVAGRVALIYEHQIRKPWRLWVFTAVLVSLTMGVVLGQAEAYQPPTPRAAATTPAPAPVIQPPPLVPLTAPLGDVKERQLEITGAATSLRIRTADMGSSLFTITSLDPTATPNLTDIGTGSLLTLTTGATGTVSAEVMLNSRVAWTLKLTGGAIDLDIDSRAGGLAGVELTAGVTRGALQLAKPRGTVPLTISGSMSDLTVRTDTGAPVRLRLAKGAGLATLNGKPQRDVKAGATLRETGWPAAKSRYDVGVTADIGTVLVERLLPTR